MNRDSGARSLSATQLTIRAEVLEETAPVGRYSGLAVCNTCGILKGTLPIEGDGASVVRVEQRCGCPGRRQEKWPRHDFNLAVELCRCCGQVLLRSGSRWSVWFCTGCKGLVGLLNGRLRRYAVPIGRHSLHGGFALNAESSDLDMEIFATTWSSVSEAIGRVDEWSRTVVKRILEERWPDRRTDIPLLEYLARCDASAGERRRRFDEMLTFLGRTR